MVKYFPYSWTNPKEPPRPSYYPANNLLIAGYLSGTFGTGLGLMRYGFRWIRSTPTTGLCMRSAAVLGVPLYTLVILNDLSRHKFQRSLEKGNTKTKPTVHFYNLGRTDIDDWQIAGGVTAFLIAGISTRRTSVLGWKRYFGAANLGIAAGTVSWVSIHIQEVMRETEKYEQSKKTKLERKEAKLQKKKGKRKPADNAGNIQDK